MNLRPTTAIIAFLLPAVAHAGLRPFYGGTITVSVPAAPQTSTPGQAWSSAEVLLAGVLGGRLSAIADGAPVVSGSTVRITVRSDATWPDGSVLDARGVANALRASAEAAVVSLPPFTVRAEGRDVVIDVPGVADPLRYLDLPWLRLTHGSIGGPFRAVKTVIEADANGLGGRPFADSLRVDVKESRHIDASPSGIALLQPGTDGRPVLALPRPRSPARAALIEALSALDRTSLSRLFVRTASHVPDDWPLPVANANATPAEPVVLLVEGSERDQQTVAQRLQVLLSDHNVTAHIAVEERPAYFARIAKGDYDLALIALPPAPRDVQAATLVRLASGREAAARFWAKASAAKEETLLRDAATGLDAVLLYIEDGGISSGARLRNLTVATPWDVDLANAWIAPAGAP